MTLVKLRLKTALSIMAVVSLVAACGLPRSGPTRNEIFSGSVQQEGDAFVVQVTDTVARATRTSSALGFSQSFVNAPIGGSDTIQPGDVLGLTIWENVEDGLLVNQGANAAALEELQVDGAGYIFVPYAGRILAAGNTPEAIRRIITNKLSEATPDPQVEVRRLAGDGATVSLVGAVGAQGVYPIERPTRTLGAMLAQAGGITLEPDVAQVVVIRGGQQGRIWFQDLYRNPNYDIALRGGDRILVEEDARSYVALGATGAQRRVPFESNDLTVIEALAQVGGLQSNTADPRGVFILRSEHEVISRRLTGRPDLQGHQRIIYLLDLTQPNGMFAASEFMIRDGDTLYVTEAPYVQWQKVIAALTGSLGSVGSVGDAASTLGN
ncbi:polysaccharide export outer membrane protein [Poseidonocella sedimentorum]|uniref:Polysaccharide export outer membrane protein n=2 Tax=Poseidonocella sedimentorum TaxID=871652 RepID=A0A1I6CUB4_9RHOB|nr:polysaccharide export outer membrane protein [Poseidonocella sedimentorum]